MLCTWRVLRVPRQYIQTGLPLRPGWEGGRECRPRALTQLLQYSRLARATTRRPHSELYFGPLRPATIQADATLVHLSHQTVKFPNYNSHSGFVGRI